MLPVTEIATQQYVEEALMKIQALKLNNYRCFEELDVSFDPQLSVFVGINGSGKTAILEALVIWLRRYAESFVPDHSELSKSEYTLVRHGANSASLVVTGTAYNTENPHETVDFNSSVKLVRNPKNHGLDVNYDGARLSLREVSRSDGSQRPVPVVVYYSSKRFANVESKPGESVTDLRYAFVDVFSPQIGFGASLAWFIEKASQEALEAKRKQDLSHTIPELSAVRSAVSKALGVYGEPFVGETPPVLFLPEINDPETAFSIDELSDGFKTMLALVMDLSRRMAIANEYIEWAETETVLHSPGVVLVDVVELHLHPSWQQTVLSTLMEIFPNVQFIVTTHSPQVLTSIRSKHIRVLKDGKCHLLSEETEGAEAGRVLEDVLGVRSRPDNAIVKKLREYADLVDEEKWDLPDAELLRAELERHFGNSEPKLFELALHVENSKWERYL